MTHSLGLRTLWLTACFASAATVQAQIRTDGSVGPAAQSLLGPAYQIPQTLGKLAGSNLFHSFQTFNIGSGQSATFSTSTPGINNVISRVTGGQMSQINGVLSLTAASGSPAFYFINPAGVTFGAGASVDVPGAFHVSTANSVKFADGRFNADLNQTSTFSTAAPEAFGFLGTTRANINIKDSVVLSPRGTFPISVIAGDVALADGGLVGARNGDIRVVAVGGTAADIPLRGAIPQVQGNLVMSNEASIYAINRNDLPPGAVQLHAGHIALTDFANVTSENSGLADAASIQIQSDTAQLERGGYVYSKVVEGGFGKAANIDVNIAQGLLLSQGASISSDTLAGGAAGDVRVRAGVLDINSKAYISSLAFPQSTGASGNIELTATGAIKINDGSVYVSAESIGSAGAVRLSASDIRLSNAANVFSVSSFEVPIAGDVVLSARKTLTMSDGSAVASRFGSNGTPGNLQLLGESILLDTKSLVFSGPTTQGSLGNAGSILIRAAGNLDIRNASRVSSSTFSDGNAGSTTIQAHNVSLDNGGISAVTGADSSNGIPVFGNGGALQIAATGHLALTNGSSIIANSFTLGNAGSVSITSAELSLSGGSSVSSKSLGNALSSGEVVAGGDAGNIRIDVLGTLAIQGGAISSGTSTTGRGGSVNVNARNISLDGISSNINAAANLGSTGLAGSLSLTAADTLLVTNGAFVTTLNSAAVAPLLNQPVSLLSLSAPKINVLNGALVSAEATGLMSAGAIDVKAGELALTRGLITTKAELGDGGNISVRGSVLRVTEAQITTSVQAAPGTPTSPFGFGNGGDIRIDADALVLQSGFIQANTDAQAASGGLIKLNVNNLAVSGNTLFLGGQNPFEFSPNLFAFNVIQAAAPTGISGTIEVASPVLDLTGSLTRLSAQVLDGLTLGRDPCQRTATSSLAVVGRGGLPASNRGLLGAPSPSGREIPAATALTRPDFNLAPLNGQLAQASVGCAR